MRFTRCQLRHRRSCKSVVLILEATGRMHNNICGPRPGWPRPDAAPKGQAWPGLAGWGGQGKNFQNGRLPGPSQRVEYFVFNFTERGTCRQPPLRLAAWPTTGFWESCGVGGGASRQGRGEPSGAHTCCYASAPPILKLTSVFAGPAIAQLATRMSHNSKVDSSMLTRRILRRSPNPSFLRAKKKQSLDSNQLRKR